MGHTTDFPIKTVNGLNNEAEYIVFSFVARVSVSDMYEEIHICVYLALYSVCV